LRLSFSTLACVGWDLATIVRLAREWGYDGVELRVADDEAVHPALSQTERKNVRRLFTRNKLAIPCLAAYTRFAFSEPERRQENIIALKQVIDLAHDLEAPYVRTFGANVDWPVDRENLARWIADGLVAVDDYATKRGVRVLLENHDLLSSGHAVRQVFDLAGPISAGVLWDVKHSLREGEAVTATLQKVGALIHHIHLKDWLVVPGLGQDRLVLLGAGALPLETIVEYLQVIGYRGFLSLEWEKRWHPGIEDSYIAIYQYIQKIKPLL